MSQGQPLDGKVAVITGGAGGIGELEARTFVDHGVRVVLSDIPSQREKAEALVAELGGNSVAAFCDRSLMDWDEGPIAFGIQTFGDVDILDNNAGVTMDAFIAKVEAKALAIHDEAHGRGLMTVTAAFCRAQSAKSKRTGAPTGGRIVTKSSHSGCWVNQGQSIYAFYKAGADHFARVVASEAVRYGVTSNVGIPVSLTSMTKDVPMIGQVMADNPGLFSPAHIANLTVALCLPDAGNISGGTFESLGQAVGLRDGNDTIDFVVAEGESWTPADLAAALNAMTLKAKRARTDLEQAHFGRPILGMGLIGLLDRFGLKAKGLNA